jgi:hypothetical protein
MVCKTAANEEQLAGYKRAPHLWIINIGASYHICFEKSLFCSFDEDYHVYIQAGILIITL